MEHLLSLFVRSIFVDNMIFRILPGYVFIPGRFEECEDCRRTGYRRNFCVAGDASGELLVAN